MTTVRFAPSPTGLIHIGNARTALFNWLFAKQHGGRYVLRFDDTDQARSRDEFAEAIEQDLAWLGVAPDLVVRQSERLDLYARAVETLKAAGRLYPCYESADELERKRKRQLARHLPPVYDRAALKLGVDERARLEAEGRAPHWRFLLDQVSVSWNDLVRGEQTVDAASLSDPVLVREDGSYLYTLPSVVDDINLGITHVIRGEDHVANTGAQIQVFQALGAPPPAFGHHNLLTTVSGEGLSKRTGSLSLASLRESGLEPQGVASVAVLIGTSEPVEACADLQALGARFGLDKVSRAPARFDPAELEAVNARLLHTLPYERVRQGLDALGVGGGAGFWEAVRANCARLSDAATWWRVATEAADPMADEADRSFLAQAKVSLPPEPWDAETWARWTGALKAETGRKGAALFRPLRLALTGRDKGPELAALLPFIGRARTLARLP